MKKQLFIILSIFLLATNSNVANGYNNVLHEVNNFEFGLQSSVYSNNGILDYSPELGRIGRAIVHMGHRKFWTHPATQNGITYLSWIAPIGKGVTLLSNIIRTGAKLITKQAVLQGSNVVGNIVKGFTEHGLNQTINRGFKPADILKIIREGKPIDAIGRYGTQTRYTLGHNTVVINAKGRIISVFSNAIGTAKELGNGFLIPF